MRIATMAAATVAAVAGLVLSGAARAATFTELDFTKNATFHSITTALTPPTGDDVTGNQGSGIPFDIPTTGNQIWRSDLAAASSTAPAVLTINVGLYGVDSVYSLMNTMWGSTSLGGTVEFVGSGGLSQSFTLLGGRDLRDYNYNPSYTLSIGSGVTSYWWATSDPATASKRLDMQSFDLDAAFLTATLEQIIVTDTGRTGSSRIFLSGVTVETLGAVPLPAGGLLLIGGLGALGALKRRKRA